MDVANFVKSNQQLFSEVVKLLVLPHQQMPQVRDVFLLSVSLGHTFVLQWAKPGSIICLFSMHIRKHVITLALNNVSMTSASIQSTEEHFRFILQLVLSRSHFTK